VTERPRDRLGRPLPWDATGFPGVEQRSSIAGAEAVREAHDYLDRGLPFHAHEVLEMRWRCCPTGERSLWRGLAQAAAGATHLARGNHVGAQRLIERGAASIEEYAGPLDDATSELIAALTAPHTASGQLSDDLPGMSTRQLPTREGDED
jgi:uncharacterized protein